jgi:hypothetical protein
MVLTFGYDVEAPETEVELGELYGRKQNCLLIEVLYSGEQDSVNCELKLLPH